MTNAIQAASAGIDPMRFAEAGAQAGAGWWAAVVVAILVVGGGWLVHYLIKRQEVLVELLCGVVKDNTKAMTDQSIALVNLRNEVEARLPERERMSLRNGNGGHHG